MAAEPRTEMAERFERCIANGGVVLFPSDTVYGLACSPEDPEAIARLYELKRRPPAKASAVMFFDLDAALAAVTHLGSRAQTALQALMPGGVTVLLPNPEHCFPLASGADPDTLGLRVVSVPVLSGVRVPVMQSSANPAGDADARRLEEVPELLRAGVDLVIDGGELPGKASTVVDLRRYEQGGIDAVRVLRQGAVSDADVAAALDPAFHFNPDTYSDMIRADLPGFDAFQDTTVAATGREASRILELGTGTGETARRLLERHAEAELVGIDESAAMLSGARRVLPADRSRLVAQRLQDPLPPGLFDLVVSVLCVHHLDSDEKADLFRRVRTCLAAGGRFVLGDVVIPLDPAAAVTELTPGYDKPDTVADQLAWLRGAGFSAEVTWQRGDLAVIVADLP